MQTWGKRIAALLLCAVIAAGALAGCGSGGADRKRIVRVAHVQAESHPEHIGLVAFKEYVEEKLGDKYEIQIFPNELLGNAQKAIELTQTGAIDFTVAGTANLETFADVYEIYSMPYLFATEEAYHAAMEDREYMKKVYASTDAAGFEVVTWFDAGTRSFYATEPIETPEDMVGMKLRVQQSPASIAMVNAMGAAASPMSFGEVYTAMQQGVVDGAENNELALTNNKHGEVAKYYCYDKHQMIPDMLVANRRFYEGLPEEERAVFEEAALIATKVEREEWVKQIEEAKAYARDVMGVNFYDPDQSLFREKVLPLHEQMLEKNPAIRDIYDHIQIFNEQYKEGN